MRELSRTLDALAPTPAMQRDDLARTLERARTRRRRFFDVGVPLAFAGAACAVFLVIARPASPPADAGGDIYISIDDGTGPLVISISGG